MKSNKIRNREKLAGELGISPRALRLQVFRVRERLQPCSAAASIFAGPRNKSCVLLNYMMEEYLMTRYLLDELGEEVLTRFEERFFIDDDAFDRLLEAEEYFLMSPQRREHVEITRALLASSKKSRVRPARWYILIAAGILIVCGFSWFGIETYRLRSRLVFDLKPASAYLPYRVAIRTVEGEEIWSQDLPVPQAELSPNVLTPRDYLVRVQGRTASGSFDDLAAFPFRVVR